MKRLQAALAALPAFTPTDGAAVEASRRAADTAAANKVAECGNGDPRQRGPNCRQRELDEGAAATNLANATAAKSATDRAAKLEAEIVVIRAKLGSATIVQNVNPLGSALEQMLGAAAARLTAWQQAIVAAVFELCLVGVMVIYELLGHPKQPQQRIAGLQQPDDALQRRSGQGAATTGDQASGLACTHARPPPRRRVA